MRNSFTVIEAHSGTSAQEIAKAKRLFLAAQKAGKLYGQTYSEPVQITFSDINSVIMAEYTNAAGQQIFMACIYEA